MSQFQFLVRLCAFYLLAVAWLAHDTICYAQRVVLITAADSFDPNIGKACSTDQGSIVSVFYDNLEQARLTVRSFAALDPSDLVQAIKATEVRKEDTLVFYFSGHGFYSDTGRQLFFSKTSGILNRNELKELLLSKQARLTVILTDCCNNYIPLPIEPPSIVAAPVIDPDFKPETSLLFQKLFLDSQGVADISSSGMDEMSLARNASDGSVFTINFVETIRRNTDKDLKWSDVFSIVATATEAESKQIFSRMKKQDRQLKMADGSMQLQTKHTPTYAELPK